MCKRKKGKPSKRKKRCFNCNKTGHFAKDCRKPNGTKKICSVKYVKTIITRRKTVFSVIVNQSTRVRQKKCLS